MAGSIPKGLKSRASIDYELDLFSRTAKKIAGADQAYFDKYGIRVEDLKVELGEKSQSDTYKTDHPALLDFIKKLK